MLNNIINNKKGNIGSLCLYLNNHHELLNELNIFISEKLSSELCVTLSLSQIRISPFSGITKNLHIL